MAPILQSRWFLPCLAIATLAVLGTTVAGIPLYQSQYTYQPKPWGDAAALAMIGAAFGALMLALYQKLPAALFLLLAVAVGALFQFGFALTEGRGLDAMRVHTTKSGHATFAEDAVRMEKILPTMRHYELLVSGGTLGVFAATKPPGQLLAYMLTEKLSRRIYGEDMTQNARLERLDDTIVRVWPFIAALAVVPLYGVAAILGGAGAARLAVALYLLTPSFSLVTLHTDQVLFPLLFMGCLYLFLRPLRKGRDAASFLGWGMLAGGALYIAAFFQIALLFAGVLFVALAAAYVGGEKEGRKARALMLLPLSLGLMVGFCLAWWLLWLWLDYDPLLRLPRAAAAHAAWKHVPPFLSAYMGLQNLMEFVDWLGVPVALLAMSVPATRRMAPESWHITLTGALLLLVVYLAFFGLTVAEVARLWLFLMPLFALAAAHTLACAAGKRPHAALTVGGLQLASTYIIKVTHDFW
jgi:hypothetical protein